VRQLLPGRGAADKVSRIIIWNDVIWNDVGRDVASCVYAY
jgi:hypothetical protein